MTINISIPDVGPNLRPQITVLGVGGSGGNAVNNMIKSNLEGVDFIIANTDAQALQISNCDKKIQLGIQSTRGLGAGMRPDVGKHAAEETLTEISEMLESSHMLFIAAGMGGGTGTGAAPVIAKLAREKGILTVGVVTKPFHFEGSQRMKLAEKGLEELQQYVDTLLTIPNQNLFRIANEKTTFADAFKMADDVLYAGVRGVTDLMVQPGLINLDFSDVKTVMSEMGKAMMGTGEASGEGRAVAAAEAAIANPLIDDVSLKGAKGLIINITGGNDITLYEVDEAANRIKQEVDEEANIIYGTTCDERLEGIVRVSIVATGIDVNSVISPKPIESSSSISIDNSVYLQKSNEIQADKTTTIDENINSLDINSDNKENESFEDDHNLNLNSEVDENNDFNQNLSDPEPILEINDSNEDEEELSISEQDLNHDKLESNNFDSEETLEVQNTDDIQLEGAKIESNSEEENDQQKTSVRRLSLFDSLEKVENDENENNSISSEKNEPMHENELLEPEIKNEHLEPEIKNDENAAEEEFSAEESDIEDDFSQENESEEELLDIPTFLRRQAN